MINRRLLRIKLLQAFYAYTKRDNDSIKYAEKELLHSIEKSFDLYYLLLLLLVDVVDYAETRIELARQKKIPTHDDLNPNTRFIDTWFVKELRDHSIFKTEVKNKGLSWSNNPELIKTLFLELTESKAYNEFMTLEESNLQSDKKLLISIFSEIIAPSKDLCQILEDQSIYWNDDSAFIISRILKDIKKSSPGNLSTPKPGVVFKEKDDEFYVKNLFRKSILHQEEYRGLIEKYAKNWDVDRIALMDVLIMELALAEIIEFSNIPVKVSLNEYIEISKTYSSKNSPIFINGILDKIIDQLRKEGKVVKTGKGLIGELPT